MMHSGCPVRDSRRRARATILGVAALLVSAIATAQDLDWKSGRPDPWRLKKSVPYMVITSRERDVVVESLLAPRYNYGVPRIVVQEVRNHTLCLEHLERTTSYLDRQYAHNTLAYIAELWQQPVHLLTRDERG